ncbi:MAG: hypothetical protein GSR82_06015 [Desulfurococcales archaeon]|nr:hypothetical protein [Desulfurococcales archaeon]
MSRIKILAIIIFAITLLQYSAHTTHAQIKPPVVETVNSVKTVTIDKTGNALVNEKLKLSASVFVKFKQTYNPLSTLVRELEPRNTPTQVENISIKVDEANNKILMKYKLLGAAVYQGNNQWEVKIGEPSMKITLSSHDDNKFVFTYVEAAGYDYQIMQTVTVIIPKDAKNPQYHEDEGTLTYNLQPPGTGEGGNYLKIIGGGIAALGFIAIGFDLYKRKSPSGTGV